MNSVTGNNSFVREFDSIDQQYAKQPVTIANLEAQLKQIEDLYRKYATETGKKEIPDLVAGARQAAQELPALLKEVKFNSKVAYEIPSL